MPTYTIHGEYYSHAYCTVKAKDEDEALNKVDFELLFLSARLNGLDRSGGSTDCDEGDDGAPTQKELRYEVKQKLNARKRTRGTILKIEKNKLKRWLAAAQISDEILVEIQDFFASCLQRSNDGDNVVRLFFEESSNAGDAPTSTNIQAGQEF